MQRVARVRARPQAAAHAKRSQGRRTKSRRNTPIDGNREGATEPRAATTTGTCAQVGAADYGHAHHMQVGRRCRHASYRSAMVARPHAGNAPATRCWREGSADRAGRCDACGRPRHAAGCARARPPTGLTAPRHARRFFRKVKGRTDGRKQNDAPADIAQGQAIASRAARDGCNTRRARRSVSAPTRGTVSFSRPRGRDRLRPRCGVRGRAASDRILGGAKPVRDDRATARPKRAHDSLLARRVTRTRGSL